MYHTSQNAQLASPPAAHAVWTSVNRDGVEQGSSSETSDDELRGHSQDRQKSTWPLRDQCAALFFHVIPNPCLSWDEVMQLFTRYLRDFGEDDDTVIARTTSATQCRVYRLMGEEVWKLVKKRKGDNLRPIINRERFRRAVIKLGLVPFVRELQDRYGVAKIV